MLELVIFDMDGLMFATEQVNCRAFMEVVKEEGYHPTFEQFTSFLGMNARDIQKKYYDYYGEDTDAEGIYKKVGSRAKQIIKEEGVPEKNGLRELLNAVKEKKLHTAVASGSDTSVIKEYLEKTGLTEYFDMVLSSKDVKRGKPYPGSLSGESSCYKRSGSASDSGRTTGKMRGSSERFSSGDSVA